MSPSVLYLYQYKNYYMYFNNWSNIFRSVFVIILWIYFSTVGDYIIIYQNNHSLFLFDKYYYSEFLKLPGGLSEYVAAFFVQFFYFKYLGALLISLLFTVIVYLSQRIISAFNNHISFIAYAPAIILLLYFKTPEFGLTIPVAIIINLLAILLILRIKSVIIKLPIIAALIIILYFITSTVFFMFSVILVFLLLKQIMDCNNINLKIILGISLFVAVLLSLLTPFIIGVNYFHLILSDSYFRLIGDEPFKNPVIFISFLLSIFLLPIAVLKTYERVKFIYEKRYIHIVIYTCLVLFAVFVLFRNYDKRVSQMIHMAEYANNEKWDDVLQISKEYKGNNYLVSYYTNVALLMSDKIDKDLLKHNQSSGARGLFFTWDRSRKKSEHGGLLYYHLGFINEAHHWAFESLISNGVNSRQLKMLALTNLINGRFKTSDKYLNKLRKSLFYSDWANDYSKLNTDSVLWSKTELIRDKRAQIPKQDFFMNLKNLAPDLEQMVKYNPDNRAALSYLLSYYLLSNQVNKFSIMLQKYNDNGEVSKLYQEALLIYIIAHPKKKTDFKDLVVSAEVYEEFKNYAADMRKYRPRRGKIDKKFTQEYGDTYWYYLHFVSPHGNKVITKNEGDNGYY